MNALLWSRRLYRGLLWLYPPPFRQRFGMDMQQVFVDMCRAALAEHGNWGLGWVWLQAFPDFLLNAAKEQFIYLGYSGAKQMSFDTQIVSTFELFVRMLRTGYSVKQVLEFLAQNAPEPTASEAQRVLGEIQQGGDFLPALLNWQQTSGSAYLPKFIQTMVAQRQRGSNLADDFDAVLNEVRTQAGRDGWSDDVHFEGE